jgi:hypothetical protein
MQAQALRKKAAKPHLARRSSLARAREGNSSPATIHQKRLRGNALLVCCYSARIFLAQNTNFQPGSFVCPLHAASLKIRQSRIRHVELCVYVQVLIKGQACVECENAKGETAAASLTAVKFRNRIDPSDAEPGR